MAKGKKTGGGSRKGSPNKLTVAAKEAIQQAFDGLGGVPALTTWAQENPNIFYGTVWPKVLPLQLAGDKDNPLQIIHAVSSELGTKLDRLAKSEADRKAKG